MNVELAKPKKLSKQQQKVYDYIATHNGATVRELLNYTNYPTSVVRDIKAKGFEIKDKPVPNTNYIEYYIPEPVDNKKINMGF